MAEDKVVYLKFDNPNAPIGSALLHISCATCKNKTFLILEDDSNKFRLVRCACCGYDIGRIGWVPDD